MPFPSRFQSQAKTTYPKVATQPAIVHEDLRGLDMTSPYDSIQKNRTPYARNFRMYAEETDDRRVSISDRKGSGRYLDAIGEAISVQDIGTTGSTDRLFTNTIRLAIKFVPTTTGPLTRVDLRLKQNGATGPIVLELYANNGGVPSATLLADTGILNADVSTSPAYSAAHFVQAPVVTSGQTYWIVAYMQDDGTGSYSWRDNTASTNGLISTTSGVSWTALGSSLAYKAYVASSNKILGATRYTPDNAANSTLFAQNTTMWKGSDNTGASSAIYNSLSSSAQSYNFAEMDGKKFWVNGVDLLIDWDGTSVGSNSNLVVNGTFETDASGWTGGTGTAVSQTTTSGQYRTGVGGLSLLASAGNAPSATYAITFTKGQQYVLNMYVKGTSGQTVYPRAQGVSGPAVTLTGGWDLVTMTFVATASTPSTYGVLGGTVNSTIYVDDVTMSFTGITQIINNNLPALSLVISHKNRLFGVSPNDPNKLIYSEDPGNDDGAGNTWYNAWLSTSFIYVPSPKAQDPITALAVFQDNLYIFTKTSKYVLYGSDPGSFNLRKSTGAKGVAHQRNLYVDENFIYFASDDAFYRHNGSSDENISELVQPEVSGIPDPRLTAVTKWKRQIRFYYATPNSSVNTQCLIYHTVFQEWLLDTDTYISQPLVFTDGDDQGQLAEVSSVAPQITYAEIDYNNYGKAIDFSYYCNYDSMGNPAVRKRLQKLFPLLEGENGNYKMQIGIDKDRENTPQLSDYFFTTSSPLIGHFAIGDGTRLGRKTSFKPARVRTSGYAYYWQLRFIRKGINLRIRIIGYVLSIRSKRL